VERDRHTGPLDALRRFRRHFAESSKARIQADARLKVRAESIHRNAGMGEDFLVSLLPCPDRQDCLPFPVHGVIMPSDHWTQREKPRPATRPSRRGQGAGVSTAAVQF
jgi:hypothetical protein